MLSNLGIARVKVKDITKSLALREKQAIDPFNQGFDRKSNGKNINLHQLRLCFQVYEINNIEYFIHVINFIGTHDIRNIFFISNIGIFGY